MQMLRPPGIVRVAPGISAGLDRQEAIRTVGAGHHLSLAEEIFIERRIVLIRLMAIAPGRVRLPELDQRARHRTAILVEDASRDDDAFADGLALALLGEVGAVGSRPAAGKDRP